MIGSSMRAAVAATVMLGLALASIPAAAQQLLYPPPPPRGSAQVRFVNATSEPLIVRFDGAPTISLGVDNAKRVAAYLTVPDVKNKTLAVNIERNGANSPVALSLPADQQVSVVLVSEGKGLRVLTITDIVEFNQVRSRLRFYNAAPTCTVAGVTLQPGRQSVFADVPTGATRMRAVNPVTADIGTLCDAVAGPTLSLSGMEVGRGYSVWLMAPAGILTAFVSSDGNALYQP